MKIALGIFICVFIFCVLFVALAPNSVHEMIDRIHGNSDKRTEDISSQFDGTEDTGPRFSRRIDRYNVSDIDFSPDGQFIAVASELGIELYNAQAYGKMAFFEDKNDGRRDGAIREAQHYRVMFSPDGQMLASAHDDYQDGIPHIKLWSVTEKRETATFKVQNDDDWLFNADEDEEWVGSFAITFSPDSQVLAIGSGRTIKLWSVTEKRETATFKNEVSVFDLAFSPDGQTLAVGSSDETIRLWSIPERREFAKFGESISRKDYEGRGQIGVFSVRFSSDGRTLAGERDGIISLWSFPEGDLFFGLGVGMAPMSMGWLWSIAFSPDMKMLASGHFDGTVRLWVVPEKHEITPELMHVLNRDAGEDPLEITSLKEDKGGVNCLAFSPDGRTLISGHESGTVQIWDIPTTYEILSQPGKSKLPE